MNQLLLASKERLIVLLDADRSSVLGNATNGILSALDLSHALHTQDTDLLLQLMKPMLNPRMTEAVRALSDQYEVLVAIYTARGLIAQTLIREGGSSMQVLADGKTVVLQPTRNKRDLNYLRAQARPGSMMSEALAHLGLLACAMADAIGLKYAPAVFVTHGTKSPRLVKTHMGFPNVRAVLFDDQGIRYARQLLPDAGLSKGQRAIRTGILPVRPFDIAQWDIPAAQALAATLNANNIRPKNEEAVVKMFMNFFTDFTTGRWDFAPAIRKARDKNETWELDKDAPWPIRSVALIGNII